PPVTWGLPGGTPQMDPHSLSPHRRYSSTFVSLLVQVKSDALQGVGARVRIHLFSNVSPAVLAATRCSRPETNRHHSRTSRTGKHRLIASGKSTAGCCVPRYRLALVATSRDLVGRSGSGVTVARNALHQGCAASQHGVLGIRSISASHLCFPPR